MDETCLSSKNSLWRSNMALHQKKVTDFSSLLQQAFYFFSRLFISFTFPETAKALVITHKCFSLTS